jgi:hypothetical protein
MSTHSHSAAHQALGYLYQSHWPLLQLIQRTGEQPDLALSLELHDDVSWEQDGTPVELLQLKHHVDRHRGLGDMDVDLWKTLGVWMDAHTPADPLGPMLTLVTTSSATAGAAQALRPDSRSVELARTLLDAAAADSTSASTSGSRERYLALDEAERDVFVSRIYVLDGAPQAGADLEAAVRQALYVALPPNHEDSFLDQLWGWWNRQAVKILQRQRDTVSGMDVRLKIQEIGDGYKPDNLPTLVERDDVDIDLEATYGSQVFVEQLRWILHSAAMLQKAMVDYYRAYVQRAQWVERDLIGIGELETFEDNLVDEWERAFDAMRIQLGSAANEEAKEKAGHVLFQEVSNQTAVRVRERYTESFFMRGRLHEFADAGRVGWHPDFSDRVKELLEQ